VTEKRIAILGEPTSWHSKALIRAWKKNGMEIVFADPIHIRVRLGSREGVCGGEVPLSQFDLVMVRDIPGGSLEQVIFRMDALHQLENSGVRLVNSPYAIEKMVDKYYTSSLLQKAGLRVPETIVTETYADTMHALHELGGDVVVKPLFGNRGIGMVRVTDDDTAGRVFRALQVGGYVYYLQKFIPHDNRDIRVMVVGNACIAAMERVANDWKTNVAAGGIPNKMELSDELTETSLRAANAVGADYCGVDLLRSERGELFVLEVNSMPAWQGLQQVTRLDIAERLVAYCGQILMG
jgi:RimK family alpha-L-glutamate ligase